MKIKVTKLDKVASYLCRKRDGYRCRRCGKKHKENSRGLHAAHIIPRRYKSIRWHLDNLISLCFGCHRWFDENKWDSIRWIEKELGEDKVNWLRSQALIPFRGDYFKWEVYLDDQ